MGLEIMRLIVDRCAFEPSTDGIWDKFSLLLEFYCTRLSHFDFDAFFDTLRFTFDTSPFDFDTSPFDFDAFNFKAF